MNFTAEALAGFEEDAAISEKQAVIGKQKLFFNRRVLRLAFRLGFEACREGSELAKAAGLFDKVLDQFYPLGRRK